MAHEVTSRRTEDEDVEVKCSCGATHRLANMDEAALWLLTHRTQGFFADFAAETRKPHYGEMQKDFLKAVLTRAIEAKLYTPEGA